MNYNTPRISPLYDQIYKHADQILLARGTLGNWNPVTLGASFEDDRIIIEARISSDGHYDMILFGINQLSEGRPLILEVDFGLPKRKSDPDGTYTHVMTLDASNPQNVKARFYRPGRWVKYLEHLYNTVHEEAKDAEKLHGQRVNDEALFHEDEFRFEEE